MHWDKYLLRNVFKWQVTTSNLTISCCVDLKAVVFDSDPQAYVLVSHCGWFKGVLVHLWTSAITRSRIISPSMHHFLTSALEDHGFHSLHSKIISWHGCWLHFIDNILCTINNFLTKSSVTLYILILLTNMTAWYWICQERKSLWKVSYLQKCFNSISFPP